MHATFRIVALAIAFIALMPLLGFAHSQYGKALKQHYELRAVTCFACHQKGKDKETGKALGREHLNDLGSVLHERLKEQNFTERFEAAKRASAEERKQLDELATKAFLKVLGVIEDQTSGGDTSWGERIKSGEHEGIRLKQ